MQKVVSSIENAGSAAKALKGSETLSSTPGQTFGVSMLHGDISDSWSNPFRNAPGGPKTQNQESPSPFRIDAICSPSAHLLLKEEWRYSHSGWMMASSIARDWVSFL